MEIQLVVLNNKVNLNGVVCTKEFINNIVADQEKYKHLPLFCDLDKLRSRGVLSHNYNARTDEFGTSQIGSFTSFSKMELDGVVYLIGTAKVSKRNSYIIDALEELAKKEELKFSYEVVAEATVNVDGVEYITGDPENYLIGVAVVTDPAVPEARALQVAEAQTQSEEKEDVEVDKELKQPEEEKELVEAEEVETVKEEDVEIEKAVDANPELKEKEEPQTPPASNAKEEEMAACGTDKEKAACGTDKEKAAEEPAVEDDKKEQIIKLEKENASMKEELAAIKEELSKMKTAEEEKVKASKRQELLDKVSTVLDEEEIALIRDAIDDIDENAVNAALAEKLLKEKVAKDNKKKKPFVASFRMTDSCKPADSGLSKWISE